MAPRYYGLCEKCQQTVSGEPGTDLGPAFAVTGWELLRDGGGANQIHGRTRVGTVRHIRCLPKRIQDEAQGRLL